MTETQRKNVDSFIRRAKREGFIESLGGGWFRVPTAPGKVQGKTEVVRALRQHPSKFETYKKFQRLWFGWDKIEG